MKPALLIVDMQKEFITYGAEAAQSMKEALRFINAAIALFRSKNLPVVCIQDLGDDGSLSPGDDGFEPLAELELETTDVHIHKAYGNAFNKTKLSAELTARDIDTIIVTGYSAEHCVLSTYRGAQDLDLTPIMLRGALASDKPENIQMIESISNLISYGALSKALD